MNEQNYIENERYKLFLGILDKLLREYKQQ